MTETSADEDVRTVLGYELRLLAPDTSHADLEALLHPDFSEVIPDGRRFGRSELITLLTSTSTGRDLSPRTAVELAGVRLSSSTIIVTYVSEQGAKRARRVTMWLRTGPSWRAYFHQATPIQPHP
ncbi:MAG TPA: nuclear transport factor 2 family protein [Streptosporangiaceae bacterium]|nr:nuclear transport factor 2 family protein [Streptosporangiaceae bacterium]